MYNNILQKQISKKLLFKLDTLLNNNNTWTIHVFLLFVLFLYFDIIVVGLLRRHIVEKLDLWSVFYLECPDYILEIPERQIWIWYTHNIFKWNFIFILSGIITMYC